VLPDGVVPRGRRAIRAITTAADWTQGVPTWPVQADPPIVATEAATSDPGHLSQRTQLVEQPRLVAGDACRQDVALEDRRRQGDAGELVDDLGQPLQRGGAPERRRYVSGGRDAMPRGKEAGQGGLLDRLDLTAQPCERSATK
jgi:hypothetical protein